MKRSIADRVREQGYRVETFDGRFFKVYQEYNGSYLYIGLWDKQGLKDQFNV